MFPLTQASLGPHLFQVLVEVARLQREGAGKPPSDTYDINELRVAINGTTIALVACIANMVGQSDGVPAVAVQIQLLRDTALSLLSFARDQEVALRSAPTAGAA